MPCDSKQYSDGGILPDDHWFYVITEYIVSNALHDHKEVSHTKCLLQVSTCILSATFVLSISDTCLDAPDLISRRTNRNLSEEKINQRTYYDIEGRGELLVSPDRVDEWGEELTEMGKWQRTNVRALPCICPEGRIR